MKRILSIVLCLTLVFAALPAISFADDVLPEGLYWRGTAREPNEETGFKIFADPDMPLSADPITGCPGEQTGCVQIVYCDGAGNETPLTCADLTFTERDTYYQANDPVPMFVREGEVLVDIIRMSTGNTGEIKYTKDEKEFSLSIVSVLPDFGIYSGMEGSEEDVLFSWDYDGTNDTIYFVAKDGFYLNSAWIDEEDAEWMGLEVGTPVDHKAVALTITDIDSFQGGFDLHYSWTADPAGSGELHEDEIYIFLFDMRPLIFRWVDEHNNVFEVQDNEDRTMWAAPGNEMRVQFSYMNEDGSFTVLKLADLEFEGCTADFATDWDGNVVDESYIVLTFDNFGEASVTYTPEGGRAATLSIHIGLPEFGYYSIERPAAEEGSEDWNDELRDAFQKEWLYDGTNKTLYVRGVYNSSLAWITDVEEGSDHDASCEILENGKLIKVTLEEPNPNQDWLNLRILCERRDDEGNVIFANEEYWANIRVNDVRSRLVFFWADRDWDDEQEKDIFTLRDWENPSTSWWTSPGYDACVGFACKDAQNNITAIAYDDLRAEGNFFTVRDLGEGFVEMAADDFGKGYIYYKGHDDVLPVLVNSDLPEFGFYSIEEPTVPQYLEDGEPNDAWNDQLKAALVSEWRFDSTNKELTIRGAYNQSLAYITRVEQDSDHDVSWEISADERSVKVTLNEPNQNQEWLNLKIFCERRDDEGNVIFADEEYWANIRVVDVSPRLMFYWAEGNWDDEQQKDVFTLMDWEDPNSVWWCTPGNDAWVGFVYKDGDGNITRVGYDDLQKEGDCFTINDLGDGFVNVKASAFGEGYIYYKGHGNVLPVRISSDLPEFGYYGIEKPNVPQYLENGEPNEAWNDQLKDSLVSEWRFDGTNSVLYVRGSYNQSLAYITRVEQSSDHDVSLEISADERSVKVTLNEPNENQEWLNLVLYCERREDDGTVIFSDEEYHADIRIRDVRPALVWMWPEMTNAPDGTRIWQRSADGYQNRSIYASPGWNWTTDFRFFDGEDLQELSFSDLSFSGDCLAANGVKDQEDFVEIHYTGFGEGTISYTKDSIVYVMPVKVGLPDVGFYNRPEATEENFITEWIFTGDNDTIYLMPSAGYALGELYRCEGPDVTVTQKDGYYEIKLNSVDGEEWLETEYQVGEIHGTEVNWYGNSGGYNIDVWYRQPGLVWRWADCWDWIEEENRPQLGEREYDFPERSLTMSPGDEWWGQFFLMDENQDLSYAKTLTFDSSLVDLQKYTVDGKVFYRIRCLDFGESDIASGENKLHMTGVLPQVGFYSSPQATEAGYLRGEWAYDGTDATKTVYYAASDGWALKDICWTGGAGADIDFDQTSGYAAITLTDPGNDHMEIRMIFAQLDENGNEVWNSGWRDDQIRIRDTRPVLIGEQWSYYTGEGETEPSWHQREVWNEGETGRWAGYVHHLRFRGPGGYITSGIESSDESIVTLSFNSEDEIWETDIHGYGQALLTWTDPSDGETYTFRIHAGEPDGFYMDPEPYLDTYLHYDGEADAYLVEYTKGEGCTVYLRDFGYYEKGIRSVEVISGNATATVKSLDMAEISVSKTAGSDFDAVIKITYELFDGDEGPDSENVTISFHATGRAKRKLRSRDGLVEAIVDKDEGTAVFNGDLSEDALILLASYDENGRFMGLKTVTRSGDTVLAEDGADNVSIFWIDGEYAPKSEKAIVMMTE